MSDDKNAQLRKAVERWAASLLDMTGKNRLIYYRKLQQGTLELDDCVDTELAKLDSGAETSIQRLFSEAPDPDARAEPPVSKEELKRLIENRTARANKKATTIFRTWKVYEEEKGISILYLARGFVTWPKDPTKQSVPNAPVLLAPLEIRRADASGSDFKIRRVGDWEVNETLLRFLSEQFNVRLTQEVGRDADGEPLSSPDVVVARLQAALPRVELSSSSEQVIGNFTYAKLPMVKDLQDNPEMLIDHDLIAAIAGDETAEAAVREANNTGLPDLAAPNFTPPADEFLVLDADSSQNYVINAAIVGKSLVVEGPPGTGKSQTIANTIAALTARGQSVLFVAEKRAAIDAVAKRLNSVGLQDLVLDLHAKEVKAKTVIQSLQSTSLAARTAKQVDNGERHRRLQEKRETLLSYAEALHAKHQPSNLSLFELNEHILRFDAGPTVALEGDVTNSFTPEQISTIETAITEWVDRRRDIDWTSSWSGSEVESEATARALLGVIEDLLTAHLPHTRRSLATLSSDLDVSLEQLSVGQLLAAEELSCGVRAHEKYFDPDIWTLDLEEVGRGLTMGAHSAEHRGARRLLKSLRRKRIWRPSRARAVFQSALEDQQRWAQLGLGPQPSSLLASSDLRSELSSLGAKLAELEGHQSDTLVTLTFEELQRHVSELDADRSDILAMGRLAETRRSLVESGFLELVEGVEAGEIVEEEAKQTALRSIYEAIKRRAELKTPEVSGFSASNHNTAATDYLEGDTWHRKSTAGRIRRIAAEALTEARNNHPEQASILSKELNKRSRHKSLRDLQELAPDVLLAMKPCWMMSPLMVSQVLPPKALFDYVIFDEASQVRPEDAVCSIARGRSTIIAGDRQQLPPSDFFSLGDDGSLDGGTTSTAMTAGYESILDIAAALLPPRYLEWHYRSRDERLIALSNAHMYGGSLVTFPGNMTTSPIAWHRIQYTPTSTREGASNKAEVEKVVELILEHARAHAQTALEPGDEGDAAREIDNTSHSLGVIAFGQPHATAIETELSRRLRELNDPELEDFFSDANREPFFVKNLERVQGDERNRIILSVGYGRGPDGVVRQNFTPINREGGERRINVAASRARSQMTVVSSISSSEVKPTSKGPQLLQALLGFAESLGNDVGLERDHEPLNAFELRVKLELEALGMRVIPQYGVGRFRIDFVLSHPEDPNNLVLAVEADGASYHSQPTARDRDRLRQQILEDKGWRFYRIWSTDFFKNPKAEAHKVQQALHRAINGESELIPKFSNADPWDQAPSGQATPRRPRLPKNTPIDKHDIRKLVALVDYLTQGGQLLLADEELRHRMKEELGYSRLGPKIAMRFDNAIQISRGEAELPAKPTSAKAKTSTSKPDSGASATRCSCGGFWVKVSGRYGTFWGCSNYRAKGCKKTRPK